MKKLLPFSFLLICLFSCKKEDKEGIIIFYSMSGSYDIVIDNKPYAFVTTQSKEPSCKGANASGIKTVQLPVGDHQVKFSSRQGFASIDRTIRWEEGCKTYNIR